MVGNTKLGRGVPAPRRAEFRLAQKDARSMRGWQPGEDEFSRTIRSYPGHMFRSIEIWSKTTRADQEAAEIFIIDWMRAGETLDEIAMRFVNMEDNGLPTYDVETFALALAFQILVYGRVTAH